MVGQTGLRHLTNIRTESILGSTSSSLYNIAHAFAGHIVLLVDLLGP